MLFCQMNKSLHNDKNYDNVLSVLEKYEMSVYDNLHNRIFDDSLVIVEAQGSPMLLEREKLEADGIILSGTEISHRQAVAYLTVARKIRHPYKYFYGIIDYSKNSLVYYDMTFDEKKMIHEDNYMFPKDGKYNIPQFILNSLNVKLYTYIKNCREPSKEALDALKNYYVIANQNIDFRNELGVKVSYITFADLCQAVYRDFGTSYNDRVALKTLNGMFPVKQYDSMSMNFYDRITKFCDLSSSALYYKMQDFLEGKTAAEMESALKRYYHFYMVQKRDLSLLKDMDVDHLFNCFRLDVSALAKIKNRTFEEIQDEITDGFCSGRIDSEVFYKKFISIPLFDTVKRIYRNRGSDLEHFRKVIEDRDGEFKVKMMIRYLDIYEKELSKGDIRSETEYEKLRTQEIVHAGEFYSKYKDAWGRFFRGYPVGMGDRVDQFAPKKGR